MLKAMSDYLAAQTAISFGYDTNLEVVTDDHQKFLLASSGTMDLSRPDKFRATRHGGFANVEMVFDGKTLTLLGKDANLYTQVESPARSIIWSTSCGTSTTGRSPAPICCCRMSTTS